ncbi:hypothetical protein ABFV55_28000, partial [Pseudomonas syringae]|uniref:hypothetical protein n=1 Tax=Pseudomonas syringae TaxID=317 RepID=UPI0034D96C29
MHVAEVSPGIFHCEIVAVVDAELLHYFASFVDRSWFKAVILVYGSFFENILEDFDEAHFFFGIEFHKV